MIATPIKKNGAWLKNMNTRINQEKRMKKYLTFWGGLLALLCVISVVAQTIEKSPFGGPLTKYDRPKEQAWQDLKDIADEIRSFTKPIGRLAAQDLKQNFERYLTTLDIDSSGEWNKKIRQHLENMLGSKDSSFISEIIAANKKSAADKEAELQQIRIALRGTEINEIKKLNERAKGQTVHHHKEYATRALLAIAQELLDTTTDIPTSHVPLYKERLRFNR